MCLSIAEVMGLSPTRHIFIFTVSALTTPTVQWLTLLVQLLTQTGAQTYASTSQNLESFLDMHSIMITGLGIWHGP